METREDKLVSVVLAVGLHLALAALMFVGMLWQKPAEAPSVRGEPITATLVLGGGQPAAATPPQRPRQAERETAPPPQPTPERAPQTAEAPPQAAPQAPVQRPDTEEAERAARNALAETQRAEREQREKQRQEQVLLEQQAQQEAQRLQRLREQAEAERQAELDKIRQQREAAERQRRIEEERLKQLQDMRDQQTQQNRPGNADREQPATQNVAEVGNRGIDDSLLGRYRVAITQSIYRNWLRPETTQPGLRCRLVVTQIPGGEVISVAFSNPCNADELTRRSIEAAVMKANPLPYDGFQSVFERQFPVNFTYDGR